MGLEGSDLTPLELRDIGRFTWRRGAEQRELVLRAARPQPRRMLVRFEGVNAREAATTLTNGDLWADESVLPDPGPGVAYAFQLVGLRVVDADGRELGTLAELMTSAANPVYVVRGEREWLIPATPEVVKKVDLAGGVITVALPAGLDTL